MDLRVSGKDLIQNHLTMARGFVAFRMPTTYGARVSTLGSVQPRLRLGSCLDRRGLPSLPLPELLIEHIRRRSPNSGRRAFSATAGC